MFSYFLRYILFWYSGRDSNSQATGLKPAASASCATGAWQKPCFRSAKLPHGSLRYNRKTATSRRAANFIDRSLQKTGFRLFLRNPASVLRPVTRGLRDLYVPDQTFKTDRLLQRKAFPDYSQPLSCPVQLCAFGRACFLSFRIRVQPCGSWGH